MDPDAAYARWKQAVRDGDREEAADAHDDLVQWLHRGGFEPRWTEAQRAKFMNYGGYSDADWGQENPTTDAEHLRNSWIVVGGAAAIGIIGYLIWRSQQTTTTVASTYQGTQLGPGGSNVPLPSNQPTGPQGS